MSGIVATPGASDANSYATLAEASGYCAHNLYSADWDAATDPQRESALIMATRLIDSDKWPWLGSAASDSQSLGWPRVGMISPNGFPIPNNVIPQRLKDATAEFARQLFGSDRQQDNDPVRLGLHTVRAGQVSLGFNPKQMEKEEASWIIMPDLVRMMLQPWKQLTYEEQIIKNKMELVFEDIK